MRRGNPHLSSILLLVGAIAGAAGSVGPWIPHPAAGLRVSGFDLFEATKLFPAVRSGAVPLLREAFILPLLVSAVALATAPTLESRLPRPLRWVCLAVGAIIALSTLPPYPAILTAFRDPLYRGRFYLALGSLLLVVVSPAGTRLPRRALGVLLALPTVSAVALSTSQFARVRPLFAALYAAPVGIGWGLVVTQAGLLTLLVGGLRLAVGRPRPESG